MLAFFGRVCYHTQAVERRKQNPGVAKFGIALEWGSRGRWFESSHSDHKDRKSKGFFGLYFSLADSNPSKCNSPVDCCLPTAGRRLHLYFLPIGEKMKFESVTRVKRSASSCDFFRRCGCVVKSPPRMVSPGRGFVLLTVFSCWVPKLKDTATENHAALCKSPRNKTTPGSNAEPGVGISSKTACDLRTVFCVILLPTNISNRTRIPDPP